MKRSHGGFTLVELLVVIGIISVLISILLPALNKVRTTARTVACLSNLRQIGIGLFAYETDCRGLLPAGDWSPWGTGDSVTWYTLINPYLGGTGNTKVTTGIGTATSTLSAVFLCPGAVIDNGYNQYTSNPIAMGRKSEYFAGGGAPAGIPNQRISTFKPASRLVVVVDGTQNVTSGNSSAVAFMEDAGIPFWARFGTGGISVSQRSRALPDKYNEEGTATPPLGNFRWRHMTNNGINAVYGDGHAATVRLGDMIENDLFPDDWRAHKP